MKQKLVVLSDLWGRRRSEWWHFYKTALEEKYEVHYYDCCVLGNVDLTDYNENNLHQQFVKGGIDTAVNQLLKKENELVDVLGFSVGGTITWKAALYGLPVRNLYLISSSRLRHEQNKPKAYVKMFFAENDLYKPSLEWFDLISETYYKFENNGHDFYKKESCAQIILKHILEK